MPKDLFIVNPAASGGRGEETWKRFLAEWANDIEPADVVVTTHVGQATEVVAASEGYERIVAVGGDGTINEILPGLMAHGAARPSLAIVPAGTGNDIARTIGVPLEVPEAITTLRQGHEGAFDVLQIDCRLNGRPTRTYALLSCGVGFSAAALGTVKPWMKRVLGPAGGYYLATLLAMAIYRFPEMTVRVEQGEYRGRAWIVVIGNAERVSGGSMCIAPGALMDDGIANFTLVPARAKLHSLFTLFPRMPSGAHTAEPGVEYFPGEWIEIESSPPASIEIDGNPFGETPMRCQLLHRAVRVACPIAP
jgi:diacylglycerol kinase (ATP)